MQLGIRALQSLQNTNNILKILCIRLVMAVDNYAGFVV